MASQWDSSLGEVFFFDLFNHNNDLKKLYQWVSSGFGYIYQKLVTNPLIISKKKFYLEMIQSATESIGFVLLCKW